MKKDNARRPLLWAVPSWLLAIAVVLVVADMRTFRPVFCKETSLVAPGSGSGGKAIVFKNEATLLQYLRKLNNNFAISGRPRFGKRAEWPLSEESDENDHTAVWKRGSLLTAKSFWRLDGGDDSADAEELS